MVLGSVSLRLLHGVDTLLLVGDPMVLVRDEAGDIGSTFIDRGVICSNEIRLIGCGEAWPGKPGLGGIISIGGCPLETLPGW